MTVRVVSRNLSTRYDTKSSPVPFIADANSGERHSEVRLMPERLAGPANFQDVRAWASPLQVVLGNDKDSLATTTA